MTEESNAEISTTIDCLEESIRACNIDCITKGEELPIAIMDHASLLLNLMPPSLLLVNTPVDEISFNKKNHGSLKTQIHYIDNHYVVSHYDGKKITVYDSLRNFTRVDRLNCQLRKTYLFFFRNESYVHDVVYKVPQTQTNSTDCGLYAIAFATLLKSGISPCGVDLDRDQLRLHLLHCLKDGKLTFFPVSETQNTLLQII